MPARTWFERRFALGLPVEAMPDIIERLRGTPLRLEERVSRGDHDQLKKRSGDRWSILEHVGHFADLEVLWLGRLDDFAQGAAVLREADLENRATWEAGHNERDCGDLLRAFGGLRKRLVERLESMSSSERQVTSQHPRLGQPMTVTDLAFFVADHDDHHLATITELMAGGG